MNKKAFNTSDYVVGIFIFVLVFMSGTYLIFNFYAQDSSFVTNSGVDFKTFNNTFAKYNETISSANSLRDSIPNASADPTAFGFLNGLINTAWGTISSIFSTFNFMNTALYGLSDYLFVPKWVISIIVSIILVLIAFAIYRLIFQGDA